MAWTQVSRLEIALALSGSSPQGISGVSARTELASGQTPTSPFPEGLPGGDRENTKCLTALLCKALLPGLDRDSTAEPRNPWVSVNGSGGGGEGNRGQPGYLCPHGQAAISSLCLSHSLYQSCWDCLLRAHWEQTALPSPFSQKNEWVAFTVSSFLELLSTALESSLYRQGCNRANSSSPDNQWGLFPPPPPSPTHLQTSGQAVLSFLFIQTSTVIKYCGLIILREGGCLPLSPAPGVNHNWSKPTM